MDQSKDKNKLMQDMDSLIREVTGTRKPAVFLTEDMTAAEQEFEIYTALLKEGCSPEDAAAKAKEWIEKLMLVESLEGASDC